MPLQPLRALAIAGLVALETTAAAGEAQDRLFAVGVLGSVETGQELVYGFERLGDFPPDKISAVMELLHSARALRILRRCRAVGL